MSTSEVDNTSAFRRPIPDIGVVPRFARKLQRFLRRSDFDLENPDVWEKNRYSTALFGFLFFDTVNRKRLDTATMATLEFLVFRSLSEVEQARADFYVACLLRDWTRKGWIEYHENPGVLILTRDGTERITKVNSGRRGGIVFAQGPVTEKGRLKIVAILCRTAVWLAVIIAVTLVVRDGVSIVGQVVETVTDPMSILRKLPLVGGLL